MKINKKDLIKSKGNGLKTPVFPLDTLNTKDDVDKYISETIAYKINIERRENNEKAWTIRTWNFKRNVK